MFMILFIIHDPTLCDAVMDGWKEAGVSGITILPSTGMARVRRQKMPLRDDIPLMPSLEWFLKHDENLNRTLLTLVETEEMIDKVVDATQNVVGDLNLPNTGILAVLPVTRVYGLHRIP